MLKTASAGIPRYFAYPRSTMSPGLLKLAVVEAAEQNTQVIASRWHNRSIVESVGVDVPEGGDLSYL